MNTQKACLLGFAVAILAAGNLLAAGTPEDAETGKAFAALQAQMAGTSIPADPEAGGGGNGRKDEPDLFRHLARVMGVLVFVLLLLYLFLNLLKRTQGGRSVPGGGGIKVLARIALGPKTRVYLLEAGGSYLVVGEGGAGLRTLHVYPASRDAEPQTVLVDDPESGNERGSFSQSLGIQGAALDRDAFVNRLSAGLRGLRRRRASL